MHGMRYVLFCLALVMAMQVFAENPVAYQPTGLDTSSIGLQAAPDVVVKGMLGSSAIHTVHAPLASIQPAVKEDTVKEEEPVIQPLILAGSGAIAVGTGLGIAGVFGAPILIGIALLFFAAGAWLTAIGWRKLKDEPKKYKGEKIAVINYLVMGIVGVAASFYSLYVLFSV